MRRPLPTVVLRRGPVALGLLVVLSLAALLVVAGLGSPATGTAAVSGDPAGNPCLGPDAAQLLCPDLNMAAPFGLTLQKTGSGRRLLRAGNSIDSMGDGPAELRGVRENSRWMNAFQRIHKRDGGTLRVDTGARLQFKYAHQQRRWWKFYRAASFELWRLDGKGNLIAKTRTGPKVAYCLRDLQRTHPEVPGSPRSAHYPACSTSVNRTKVTLGTSPGWSDIYPPSYPEQYINVTDLRGCFVYRHTADPRDVIRESDETNNVAEVVVRLPWGKPAAACPQVPGAVKAGPGGDFSY